ncbi:hypothetical protein L596_025075 [Steinernema carpocapsae]|uniref:Mediator of RNA polymerase II transcription subunit 7 n=1 Tax=Steinernema carpocapsae TaxID=34508 RepID=A0A4V6XVR6_STECR|nr:hypothetical protein L596_025075 [Steinernema carpocapsae]
MAAAPNKAEATSPFPKPSEYAKNYTTDNIKNGRVLAPPPVPVEFEVFGEKYNLEEDLVVPLKSLGIESYTTSGLSWREEFKKLNASVVANFLDLLQILISALDSPERLAKIEAIRLLFINMHHLVNEYRPVQARTTLEAMMRHQIDEKVKLCDQIANILIRAEEVICQALNVVGPPPSVPRMNLSGASPAEQVRRPSKLQSDLAKTEVELAQMFEDLMAPEGDEGEESLAPQVKLKYPPEEEDFMQAE